MPGGAGPPHMDHGARVRPLGHRSPPSMLKRKEKRLAGMRQSVPHGSEYLSGAGFASAIGCTKSRRR
jgi:hypothetical protein